MAFGFDLSPFALSEFSLTLWLPVEVQVGVGDGDGVSSFLLFAGEQPHMNWTGFEICALGLLHSSIPLAILFTFHLCRLPFPIPIPIPSHSLSLYCWQTCALQRRSVQGVPESEAAAFVVLQQSRHIRLPVCPPVFLSVSMSAWLLSIHNWQSQSQSCFACACDQYVIISHMTGKSRLRAFRHVSI